VREKTKAGIKAALWIFIVMPAFWFFQILVAKMFGLQYSMPFSHFLPLMVMFGIFAVINVAKMETLQKWNDRLHRKSKIAHAQISMAAIRSLPHISERR
jgi:hypothetical protein